MMDVEKPDLYSPEYIPVDQNIIDQKNSEFWDELCGTLAATGLGIDDRSPKSLEKFDRWYLDFYPYLRKYIPFDDLSGKTVLEVGLGYGTVAGKLIQSAGSYHGLDIAAGPVEMAIERAKRQGCDTRNIVQGSILNPPFEPKSFDWIIAIGCLHHTGDLEHAIQSVHALLADGGRATIMVYNAVSYRQILLSPISTLKQIWGSRGGRTYDKNRNETERSRYDSNLAGQAAPQTEFATRAQLRSMCSKFSEVRINSENIGSELVLRYIPRPVLCKVFGPIVGLDLYCELKK